MRYRHNPPKPSYGVPQTAPNISDLPSEDQAEAGPVVHWNDLKKGDFYVCFNPESYEVKFCEVRAVERKANCVLISRWVHDTYNTNTSVWTEDKKDSEEGKRKGTWVIHVWEQNQRHTRIVRRMAGKADAILNDLFGSTDRAKVNRRRQDSGYQVAHRSMFSQARSALDGALLLLGLSFESNSQDLRKVIRKVAFSWHPDRRIVFIEEKRGTEAEFERESKKYYDALATVQDYIHKKEQLGVTNGSA